MQRGLLPGLLALSAKFVPTIREVPTLKGCFIGNTGGMPFAILGVAVRWLEDRWRAR